MCHGILGWGLEILELRLHGSGLAKEPLPKLKPDRLYGGLRRRFSGTVTFTVAQALVGLGFRVSWLVWSVCAPVPYLWLIFRILSGNPKKELLWSLWVVLPP